jgi:transcriptional regulator with XRE-family HTH domain
MENGAQDFGRLLKHWRRVRKESQLGLSHVAGVSAKHIAFIEGGRACPSREMVLTLAQALDVPLRERNLLLRAAGFADVYVESALGAPAIEPVRRALQFVLARHDPYPAMLLDTSWNLQLANDAARRLLAAFSTSQFPAQPNVLKVLFDPRGLRPFVENWPDISGHLLRRLAREVVGTADDAPSRRLLSELLASPGAPSLQVTHPLEAAPLPFIPLVLRRGELRLSMFSLVSSLGTAIDLTLHDLRVETLLPADESTARLLRRMAERTPESAEAVRRDPRRAEPRT